MRVLLAKLQDRRLLPVLVFLTASMVLLPRLGADGFWEPMAMREAAKALPEADVAATVAAENAHEEAKARSKAKVRKEPPLNSWLMSKSLATFGVSEFSARLPFFALALVTVLATYFLGVRIRGPTSGLVAVLVLLASPLFVFQARHITTEMGAVAGGTLMVLGAVGLSVRRLQLSPSAISLFVFDLFALIVGAGLGYYSSGFLIGVLVPLGAIALGVAVTAAQLDSSVDRVGRVATLVAHTIFTALFVAALAYFVSVVFDWADASENGFSIFGKTLVADKGYQPLLAGVWKSDGSLQVNFNSSFEHIAFGMFPWIALAPIAIAQLAVKARRGTNALGARVVFAWALVAWVAVSVATRKIGPTQYSAIVAIALAIGIWFDERVFSRPRSEGTTSLVPPVVAFFVFACCLVLAMDLHGFPERFLSVHLDQGISKFPGSAGWVTGWMVLGLGFAVTLAIGLAVSWRNYARYGVFAALGLSGVLSVFVVHGWLPHVSAKLSTKKTFDVYRALREDGNQLASLGAPTPGAKFYADAPITELRGRHALMDFLKKPDRVFAFVRASEMCPIHKMANTQGVPYYVIDDSNAEHVILSNRLWSDDVAPPPSLLPAMRNLLDENPLARAIVRTKPQGIQNPLNANFDDKLELIGIDVPRTVSRTESFEVILYFKVLKPMRRNWKVFVHFDGASRFQGDHYPVNKRCGTNYWQPGDYIVDRFTVEAPGRSYAQSTYQIWAGLFVGSAPNWENMKVLSGKPDNNNRVPVGSIRLD